MTDRNSLTAEGTDEVRSARLKRYARYNAVFIFLIIAFILITIVNINSGSVQISVKEILRIIFYRNDDETAYSTT